MNRDSDIPEDLLLKLLLEPLSVDDSPSGSRSPAVDAGAAELGETTDARSTSIYPGDESTPTPATPNGNVSSAAYTPVFDSGDLSTVQSHFEALLKRRLRREIDHRPPLFPWEKGLQDYPDALQAGTASIWLDHLQNLSVPASVPEDVLASLLSECQQVASDIRQTGRRLMAAVESLFPDQPQTLEYIAGLVVRPAYRSAQAETLDQIDYTTASTQQQVALAMLAAQGIFDALSLTVSEANPRHEQSWLTASGSLTVRATYSAVEPLLEIKAMLPSAGSLVLTSSDESARSERSTPGELVLRLAARPGMAYRLDVSLDQAQGLPLGFQVMID
ncbi:MAG: hypothetical protein WBB18_14760 [Nodosilinea sp.]